MIQLNNVTVQRRGKTILDRVSVHVRHGEKVVLTGPSGSGKSSLLLTIAGAHRPTSGTIVFDGETMESANVTRLRQSIAFVGQEPVLGDGTVRDALMMPFTFRSNRDRQPTDQALTDALVRMGLDGELLDKPAGVVSGGEKQRIAVARALLLGKHVFLMDEATSALDDASKEFVFPLLAQSAFTVVSVSHDSGWIDRCDRILAMAAGRIEDA